MKKGLSVISVLFASAILPATLLAAVSLPDKVPGIVARTAQKDKAAIVMINSIVTGTAVTPSYTLVQSGAGGGGTIVATWQSAIETTTFSADGRFSGNNTQTGSFSGTYSVQGNTLIASYASPSPGTQQFTFSISGNILTLSHPQFGSLSYTKVGAAETTAGDVVSTAEKLNIVRETGTAARMGTEHLTAGASGTGFVISSDGYIITNAHVVLADKDPKTMLLEAGANNALNQLYAEASQYYNVPERDKEKVVQILFQKFMNYFMENGQITDITTNYYVLNGIASPGEDLKIKSWPSVVKKSGTVYEKIGEDYSWGQDVAIIKVAKTNLPTVTLGDSSKAEVGETIFVIGYPGTKAEELFKPESILEPTATQGVISAKRTLRTGVQALQTDAAINPGNSGGPAYNENGEVIGIATFKTGPKAGVESINFLLPVELAKEFMRELNVENKPGIIDAKYAEALNAFWNRDCHKAVARMKEVLTLYPGHPYAQDYITECSRAILAGEVPGRGKSAVIIGVIVIVCAVGIFFIVRKVKLPQVSS